MATYDIQNSETGEIITIEGDSDVPPTESEMAAIVKQYTAEQAEQGAENLANGEGVDFEDESWYDDPIMVSRMLLDGISFGAGNEALAALKAAGETSMGKPYKENFEDIHKQLVAEEREYKDEFPAAALTAQIIGSLGTGMLGVGKATAKYGMKGLMAESTAIGGATGYASTDEGDRWEGTKKGAIFSAGASGVLGSAGKVIKGVSDRRITKDLLKEDGSFTPITFAEGANEGLKSFYRDIIGASFWGSTTLLNQQDKFKAPLIAGLNKAKTELGNKLAQVDKLRKKTNDQLKGATKSGQREVKASVAAQAQKESNVISAGLNKLQDASEMGLRANIFRASIPEGAPLAVREAIGKAVTSGSKASNQEATKMIQGAWSKYGYKMLEELPDGAPRVFKLNVNQLGKTTTEAIKADPKYVANIANKADINPNLTEMLTELKNLTSKGTISGKDLARVRAAARAKINSAPNSPDSEAANIVFNTLEKNLTKTMKSQLDDVSLEAFNKTQKQYGNVKLLEAASLKATQKNGKFNGKDWIDVIKANPWSKGKVTSGQAPFQYEAEKVVRMGSKIAANTKQELDFVAKNALYVTKASENAVRRRAQQEISKSRKGAEQAGGIQPEKIAALKKTVDESTAKIKELDKVGATRKGVFGQLAVLGFMGSIVGNISHAISGGASVALGVVAGKQIASQKGQRLIAGQTAGQEVINKAAKGAESSINRASAFTGGSLGGSEEDQLSRQRFNGKY